MHNGFTIRDMVATRQIGHIQFPIHCSMIVRTLRNMRRITVTLIKENNGTA